MSEKPPGLGDLPPDCMIHAHVLRCVRCGHEVELEPAADPQTERVLICLFCDGEMFEINTATCEVQDAEVEDAA